MAKRLNIRGSTTTTTHQAKKIAVIGAGWAGCAAAVQLTQAGHIVSLIESAKILGGRARAVSFNTLNGKLLDNGQHILLGAYQSSLDLCKQVGIDTEQALLKLPLQMCYPNTEYGQGMHFVAPNLPAPLHLIFALLLAQGLQREDKLALARFSTTARWMDWRLNQDCSVSELLTRFDQTDNLCRLMWKPLCIAALNTAPEQASAQVFLHVLRDSLGAKRAASDMLIPRVDLSALMPNAAAQFVQAHKGSVHTGCTVQQLTQQANGQMQLRCNIDTEQNMQMWDGVIVATSAESASKLINGLQTDLPENANQPVAQFDTNFTYEPITTCYLQYPSHLQLTRPFFALKDEPSQQHWGQFVFDRGQLHSDQAGLLAVVVSTSGAAIAQSHPQLEQDIAQQLAQVFKNPLLSSPIWQQTITEKRATFACTPALQRPCNTTAIPNLFIAGDYTQSDYPATLEAAVQSGNKAAQCFLEFLNEKN